jgi:DNA-binding response OmpR family regulator
MRTIMSKIAVLEDNLDCAEVLRILFVSMGLNVIVYHERSEGAFLELSMNPVDMIVTDYCMPGMSAEYFVHGLKGKSRIVLITALTDAEEIAASLGVDYFSKPFHVEEIMNYADAFFAQDASYASKFSKHLEGLRMR